MQPQFDYKAITSQTTVDDRPYRNRDNKNTKHDHTTIPPAMIETQLVVRRSMKEILFKTDRICTSIQSNLIYNITVLRKLTASFTTAN